MAESCWWPVFHGTEKFLVNKVSNELQLLIELTTENLKVGLKMCKKTLKLCLTPGKDTFN